MDEQREQAEQIHQNLLRGIGYALLALKWEIRAHQRRMRNDDGDANYCETKSDSEAANAESEMAQ